MLIDYESFVQQTTAVVKKINHNADTDEDLLDEVTREIADRLAIYLNLRDNDSFDSRLPRVAARVVNGILIQTTRSIDGEDVEIGIKSVSDNGQSVSYSDNVKSYLTTATDTEIFGACTELLKPYRRIHVYS